MRILFFNPDFPKPGRNDVLTPSQEDYLHPPLGLISIATHCSRAGHEAYVCDLNCADDPVGAFKSVLKEFQPDVVGFTVYTTTEKITRKYAAYCEELNIDVVLGGPAVYFNWKSLLGSRGVSAIIRGEGEFPVVALLDALERGISPKNIPGLHLKNVDRYAPPARIADLNALSPSDFSLVDMNPYVKHEALGMITSRGCPYNCSFCSSNKMWSGNVTYLSLDNILLEIDRMVDFYNYDGKKFTFFDDTFTMDKKRTLEFCKMMKRRNYKISWKAMTRVDRVDLELLTAMHEAGCRHIVFGIEATNDADLHRLNKKFSINQARQTVELANQAKLVTEGYFIIGFPWQTRKDLFDTVDSIRMFKVAIPRLSCLTPYPGTYFAENMEKYDMRVPFTDTTRFNNLLPVVETREFTLQDQAEAMLAFIDSYVINDPGTADFSQEDGSTGPEGRDDGSSDIPVTGDFFNKMAQTGIFQIISPYIAFRQVNDNVLVFEFKSGIFALLNSAAVSIIKHGQNSTSLDELALKLYDEYGGRIDRNDIMNTLAIIEEMGFFIKD